MFPCLPDLSIASTHRPWGLRADTTPPLSPSSTLPGSPVWWQQPATAVRTRIQCAQAPRGRTRTLRTHRGDAHAPREHTHAFTQARTRAHIARPLSPVPPGPRSPRAARRGSCPNPPGLPAVLQSPRGAHGRPSTPGRPPGPQPPAPPPRPLQCTDTAARLPRHATPTLRMAPSRALLGEQEPFHPVLCGRLAPGWMPALHSCRINICGMTAHVCVCQTPS